MAGLIEIQTPAKVNLILRITGKRADGYHSILTLFHKIALFDTVTIDRAGTGIVISCPQGTIPVDERNLAHKAARSFYNAASLEPEVHIQIQKRIPVAAGLGGGSSDAAAVLGGLQLLYNNPCQEEELFSMAKDLGADVPFFMASHGMAIGRETGSLLEPLDSSAVWWFVLINPGIYVSTKWVYQNLKLTSCKNPFMFSAVDLSKIENFLQNDLESVTAAKYPVINLLKDKLLSNGADGALMSGSGPTVFGLFKEQERAESAYIILKNEIDPEWSIYLAESHHGWGVVKRKDTGLSNVHSEAPVSSLRPS